MKSSQKIRFIKSLVLGLILVFILDYIGGYVARGFYFGLKNGQYAQMTYAIDSTNHEMVILGSSRASHHYESKLMEEGTQWSVYNAGRDGQFLPYYCALLDAISNREKPKKIILDVNVWDLAPNDGKIDKLSMLLPYYSTHPEFLKYIHGISDWESLKLMSKSYPYNSTLFIMTYDYLFINNKSDSQNGFVPLNYTMPEKDFLIYKKNKLAYDIRREKRGVPFDQSAIQYYEYFLKTVDSLKIPTHIIISPTLLKEPATKEKLKLETMTRNYNLITFLDFSSDTTFNDHYEKFADEFHLNDVGAKEFSL